MTTYKLAISDTIEFQVSGSIPSGSTKTRIALKLRAKRLNITEYREALSEGSAISTREFLCENITGWSEQTLVQDEDGKPAAFCAEAFEVLLSLVGIEGEILRAYAEALAFSSTAQGRAKN